jgi:hypothetical protein
MEAKVPQPASCAPFDSSVRAVRQILFAVERYRVHCLHSVGFGERLG